MYRLPAHRFALALLLIAFILVGVGGVFSVNMMGDDMHDCPFMNSPVLCTMGPLQHISQWQKVFTAVIPQLLLALLVIAVLFLLGEVVFVHRVFVPRRYLYRGKIFDPLRLAFARGIVHTKVF